MIAMRALAMVILLAAAAGACAAVLVASPAGAAVNCSNFSTQAAAQEFFLAHGGPSADPEGLDGNHDGVACESLPCPCNKSTTPTSTPTTTAPPATDPAASAQDPAGCTSPKAVQNVSFSATKYPKIRAHFLAALRRGWPRTLVLNRADASDRRARLLKGIRTKRGYDRDEYPPAVGRGAGKGLEKGKDPVGWKADVAYVPSHENRSHGSTLGTKLRRLCSGTKFRYVFY